MLLYLANILEQLDLALEHLTNGDANNARFGLMLTDNVVELVLHQIAKDKKNELERYPYRKEPYKDAAALEEALGRHFEPKVKFAKSLGKLSDEIAESVLTFHLFRNEVYHIGVRHEAVLPTLAAFYFNVACRIIEKYSPSYLGWGSDQKLPERAKKFLSGHPSFPGTTEQFQAACVNLGKAAGFSPQAVVSALANHMSQVVEEQDGAIDFIATAGPHKTSRDKAVIDCQAWPLAFSEEGRKFARENGWPDGSILEFVEWIAGNYPLEFGGDPISAWRRRVESLQHEGNPHAALKKYRSFMDRTAEIREAIFDAAAQVDAYVDGEIQRLRGK